MSNMIPRIHKICIYEIKTSFKLIHTKPQRRKNIQKNLGRKI